MLHKLQLLLRWQRVLLIQPLRLVATRLPSPKQKLPQVPLQLPRQRRPLPSHWLQLPHLLKVLLQTL
jgi:hypothetical protein